MQIWCFIQWLGRTLCKFAYWLCQRTIGWFILGRGCDRCAYRVYARTGWRGDCRRDPKTAVECKWSITRKHFKRNI